MEEFFRTGEIEAAEVVSDARALGVPRRFGAALDFGCGVGRITQALAHHFDQVEWARSHPAMALTVGSKLGHYDVTALIGEGVSGGDCRGHARSLGE